VNLRQLEYFVAVAEHRSILKAAQSIHISQPSVSVQIKALEDELGVPLFERRRDGVILTPEGEEFLLHARAVLRTVDTARTSLQAFQSTPIGRVVVGIPGSLASLLTVDFVERTRAQLPNVQLRVVGGLSGHTRQWILDGRMDFGLVHDAEPGPGIDVERVFVEELFLATRDPQAIGHLLTPTGEIPMRALAALPLVLPGAGYNIRRGVERVAAETGITLNVIAEIDATEQMNEMVNRCGCYTVLSLAALHSEHRNWQLAAIRIVQPAVSRTVSMAHASDRPLSRAAREVQAVLSSILRAKLAEGWWRPAISEVVSAPIALRARA
jgi:LysR family nitrogen assimilation transcriptional regulator